MCIRDRIAIDEEPRCKLIQHAGNDRSLRFTANGLIDNSVNAIIWAIRFQTQEHASSFKQAYDEARKEYYNIPIEKTEENPS